jgi:LemA protein
MEIIIILAVVGLIALFFIAQYNRLVRLNITVDEAWAQIEVQLKRRADLIPNLVETVKEHLMQL